MKIEFKDAVKVHRSLCPYKSTNMTKCGANIQLKDGKCPTEEAECYYISNFKEQLRKIAK